MRRIAAGERVRVSLNVNGEARQGWAEPRLTLGDFLRHELNLFGTHVGCEQGVCGACTVILDGRLARACLVYAVQAEGAEVTTVEGLGDGARGLGDLHRAFARHGALQCGFCTAGVLLSAGHFLARNPKPDAAEVRDMLSGHLCRCTGYEGMVRAILEVAEGEAEP